VNVVPLSGASYAIIKGLNEVAVSVEIHVLIFRKNISETCDQFSFIRKNKRDGVVMFEQAGNIVGVENGINTCLVYEIFPCRASEFNNATLTLCPGGS
jgi:hypothetical protein